MNRFSKTMTALSSLSAMTFALVIGATGCASPADHTDPETRSAAADTVAQPSGLQPGEYRGSGVFKDSTGSSGSYEVSYTISANQIAGRYDWGSARPDPSSNTTLTFNLTWSSDTAFSYAFEGFDGVGAGYCVGGACHFGGIENSPVPFEQTVVFGPNGVDVVGSKSVPSDNGGGGSATKSTTIYWNEQLNRL